MKTWAPEILECLIQEVWDFRARRFVRRLVRRTTPAAETT